ncbi:homing endonuclease associated repeat-containing protein [Tuberibacillus sp. Marseille-P3662]|uniref:homing endonuclease associated repeat-containing protein n=1 Tax=Tuberibacillus sp. Marseille-P3662 TaxID=1965358 RepID=UPI000A1C80A9|nr:hypothetical protein [Tuberibacillus sp. Marseille-P3662]
MRYTNEDIIRSLRRCAEHHNGKVTFDSYKQSGLKPNITTVVKRFGSFNNALRQSGIDLNKNRTKEEIINEFRRTMASFSYIPSQIEYKKLNTNPTLQTMAKHDLTYMQALKEIGINLPNRSITSKTRSRKCDVCGTVFLPHNGRQKYCSRDCAYELVKERQKMKHQVRSKLWWKQQ